MSTQPFEKIWESFFKPEVRSAGQILFNKKSVTSSQPSDTEVLAFIKGAGSCKVTLKSNSMQSKIIIADCNCPISKKGRFCKHIWATMLQAETKHPDFLEEKNEISKKEQAADSKPKTEKSQAQKATQEAYAAKQAEYRKAQYQKQKARLKEQKDSKKKSKPNNEPIFPIEVQTSLTYFAENGFSLEEDLNSETISQAKKKLARIFHPDIGGSHEEILELNNHSEVLIRFLKSTGSN